MNGKDLQKRFVSPRVKWSKEEMVLTLAYYFFIYQTNTRKQDYESFASDLRKMTNNNRSNGSVGMRFANYISVDPRKNAGGFSHADNSALPIWNECIDENNIPKQKFIDTFINFINVYGKTNKIYNDFMRKYAHKIIKRAIDDDDEKVISTNDVIDDNKVVPSYRPEVVPELTGKSGSKSFKRDHSKAKKALVLSKFECNINCSHVTFTTKNGKQYMEAHHLIPMSAQSDFSTSLDVDANIICLCPLCHRKLHFGVQIEDDLKKLFDSRKKLLEQSGIKISFEKLLDYYR